MEDKIKAYYRGIFKIHEVELITKELEYDEFLERRVNYYLIRFKNGKLKYVHEE